MSPPRKSTCPICGEELEGYWPVVGMVKTRHRNNLIRRFGSERTAQMRKEMLTQYAPDTEMPPMRRLSRRGQIVEGDVLP